MQRHAAKKHVASVQEPASICRCLQKYTGHERRADISVSTVSTIEDFNLLQNPAVKPAPGWPAVSRGEISSARPKGI